MLTDAVSIILLIGLIQGMLLVFLLFSQGWKKTNIFLIAILVFVIWTQLEFLFVRNKLALDFSMIFATRLGSWLLLGPLLYRYSTIVIGQNQKLTWHQIVHFIPFIIFTIVIPLFHPSLLPARAVDYGILSLLTHRHLGTTYIEAFYAGLFVAQFFHLMIYLLLSRKILINFENSLKREFSNLERVNHRWLFQLNRLFFVVLCTTSVFFIILFVLNLYFREFDYLYVLPTAAIIYWVTFKLIRNPEIIRTSNIQSESSKKYEKSSLTEDLASLYKSSLIDFVEKEKPYLNNELNLSDLAQMLQMPTHHLSQVLNEELKVNFFDFINGYRIREAQKRLRMKNKSTVLQIAYEVGFNNKASFNNYFKKITNQTPTSFAKDHSK